MEIEVVAAAINYHGLILSMPKPARHHTLILRMANLELDARSLRQADQGFLMSDGTFATRDEAQRLINFPSSKLIGSILTSEDLW